MSSLKFSFLKQELILKNIENCDKIKITYNTPSNDYSLSLLYWGSLWSFALHFDTVEAMQYSVFNFVLRFFPT